jgi:hypothetical protein
MPTAYRGRRRDGRGLFQHPLSTDGKTIELNDLSHGGYRSVFRAGRMTYHPGNSSFVLIAGCLTLNRSADPPTYDIQLDNGAGWERGIFRRRGDILELARTDGRSPRPLEFVVGRDPHVSVLTLKRVKK